RSRRGRVHAFRPGREIRETARDRFHNSAACAGSCFSHISDAGETGRGLPALGDIITRSSADGKAGAAGDVDGDGTQFAAGAGIFIGVVAKDVLLRELGGDAAEGVVEFAFVDGRVDGAAGL